MGNWQDYAEEAKQLLLIKQFEEAQAKIDEGLQCIPNQRNLLTIASDISRASRDRERSLSYAQCLIEHDPGNWNGYGRAAQDLITLKRYEEAQAKALEGLHRLPNQINLLAIASDAYRASRDRETSLHHAHSLITHHPSNWNGYGRAAQDLVALMRYDEAQIEIAKGLNRIPGQVNLLVIASDVFRASGLREQSLEYAKSLMDCQPGNWNGYGRVAQDLMALKRIGEAQEAIQVGLQKFPNNANLLTIANEIYRAAKDNKTALGYARRLITHYPENWSGYERAAKDLVALSRFEEAEETIRSVLGTFASSKRPKEILDDVTRAKVFNTSPFHDVSTGYIGSISSLIRKDYDFIAGCGPNCRTAFHVRRIFGITNGNPFDWSITPLESVGRIIENWEQFSIEAEDIELDTKFRTVVNNKWALLHHHDFPRDEHHQVIVDGLRNRHVLGNLNQKYRFLLNRFMTRLRAAQSPLLIAGGRLLTSDLQGHFPSVSFATTPRQPDASYEAAVKSFFDYVKQELNRNITLVYLSDEGNSLLGLREVEPRLVAVNMPTFRQSNLDKNAPIWTQPYLYFDLLASMVAAYSIGSGHPEFNYNFPGYQ